MLQGSNGKRELGQSMRLISSHEIHNAFIIQGTVIYHIRLPTKSSAFPKHRFAKRVRCNQVMNRLHPPITLEVSTQDQANHRPRPDQARF